MDPLLRRSKKHGFPEQLNIINCDSVPSEPPLSMTLGRLDQAGQEKQEGGSD